MKKTLETLQKSLDAIMRSKVNQFLPDWESIEGVNPTAIYYFSAEGECTFENISEDGEYPPFLEGVNSCYLEEISDSLKTENVERFKKLLRKSSIYILADSLARKGWKHSAVVWALFNEAQVPEGWELPFVEVPKTEESKVPYLNTLRNKLKLAKFQRWGLALFPKGKVELEINYFGHYESKVVERYISFADMQVGGESVICWSSWVYGGTCRCNSHDPSYDWTEDIVVSDLEKLQLEIVNYLQEKYQKESTTL